MKQMRNYDSMTVQEQWDVLATVANLYYNLDLTQSQIAERMYTSRSKVSRMLKKARELGIVEIYIRELRERNLDYEQRLKNEFSLKNIRVIATKNSNEDSGFQKIAEAASYYFDSIVKPDMVVGISWGSTLYRIIKNINTNNRKNIPITVVPIMGAANILTCTSAMEWFKNNFYREDPNFYETMNRILAEVPQGSNGCLALPYFQGRSTPDWNSMATATFFNLTLNTTREDMLKALLESICMEIENNIRNFEKYVPVHEILISGGLSRSESFNQMQADVYGKKIKRSDNAESTAVGAWMVASRTMGRFESLQEAYEMACGCTEQECYASDEEIYEFYRGLRREMNHIYQRLWGS